MRETSRLAKRSGLFAGLAVASSVAFQVLMIAAIVLRPEIDPARKPISEYAIGRLGWLAVLGFLASAAAYTCLAVALRHRLRDRLGRIGLFMLCYCALATAVVGLYDPHTRILHWAHAGHLPPILVRDQRADVLPMPEKKKA